MIDASEQLTQNVFLYNKEGGMATHDTIIRDGLIYNGTGSEPYEADIAIDNGIISQIGKIEGKGRDEIDAKGQIVTPGFVDIHTSLDKCTGAWIVALLTCHHQSSRALIILSVQICTTLDQCPGTLVVPLFARQRSSVSYLDSAKTVVNKKE